MNKVILIGRLCQDPTMQYMQDQTPFVRSSIAVQRSYKNASGEYDTDFINFIAYRKTAELINKHFNKGEMVCFIGEWRTSKYQDQTGATRTSNDLLVMEIEFLPKAKPQEQSSPYANVPPPPAYQSKTQEFEVSEDDLPF